MWDVLNLTCERYVDSPSREAAEELLSALLRRNELLKPVAAWLGAQSLRELSAACVCQLFATVPRLTRYSGYFGVLCWVCVLLATTHEPASVSDAFARLVDVLLDPATPARPSVRRGAVVRARRVLRNVRVVPSVPPL